MYHTRSSPSYISYIYMCYARVYLPFYFYYYIKIYNKIDQISMEEVDRLARKPHSIVIRLGPPHTHPSFDIKVVVHYVVTS